MKHPLVTVIALSYNHAPYIKESLQSVFDQTYEHWELIIVDDASTDESAKVVKECIAGRAEIKFIAHKRNHGNCKSFNEALRYAKGEFVIDLALDDVFTKDRLEKQVKKLEHKGHSYACCFTDATYINQQGKQLHNHYKRDKEGKLLSTVPEGDVYTDVVSHYFICPPTLMIRKSVLDEIGGYDESLAYEDFDLWVRVSRMYKFAYLDEVLCYKRVLSKSLSVRFKNKQYPEMARSTLKICRKAAWLNQDEQDKKALLKRIVFEMREALRVGHKDVVKGYADLLEEMKEGTMLTWAYKHLNRVR
jgi:glycosyltransferase involved in cell wall biosynthesis